VIVELTWVPTRSCGSPTIELASVALRSANLRLLGTGQGSVAPQDYLAELPSLVAEIDSGALTVTPRTVPLADVEAVWTQPETPGERIVFTP
jgi:hypothetical protein